MSDNRRVVNVRIELKPDQVAVLKAYASSHYKPALKITWRDVASGWARMGLEDAIAKRMKGNA